MGVLDNVLQFVTGKNRQKAGGLVTTPTYNAQNPNQVLTVPLYRDHLTDLFQSRASDDSRALIKELAKHDPDVSAAIHGYLTLANTPMVVYAETVEGEIDEEATRKIHNLLLKLTRQTDYTLGFVLKQNLEQLCAELRYMLLVRGGIGAELIFDKKQIPDEIRQVDLASIRWFEKKPGVYKPEQIVVGQTEGRLLDVPTFFVSFYRRDPTSIYTHSPFVSAINTIAARQQVINDLYRIMTVTGFPRLEITVLEEVLVKRAPASAQKDPVQMRTFLNEQVASIAGTFNEIRADQAITHTDTVSMKILNEKNPGVGIDIKSVIDTLNALNQAALKTMSTMLGRGTSGANTGSVEARLAAMFADEVNAPVAEMLEKLLSFCLHADGFQGFAKVYFEKAELRPETELEPQLALRAARLRQDLSDGIITDIEYHLQMYGRLPPPSAPQLAGTGFMNPAPTVDPADVSPNQDALGRSIAPDKTKQTKSPAKKSAPPPK